jgi:hypothetical protein
MKNLTIILIALGLTIPLCSADSQSKRKNTDSGDVANQTTSDIDNGTDKAGNGIDNIGRSIDYQASNVGKVFDNLGNNIDRMINRTVDRWTSHTEDSRTEDEDSVTSSSRRSPDITDSEVDTNAQTFSGDKIVEESEVINSNVVVKGGDLTVYGTVDGNVLIVGGDLKMKRTGKVTGNARVVNGSIRKESGAIIRGNEDYSKKEKISFRPSRSTFSRTARSFDVPWAYEPLNLDNFIFRYNRVEGAFFGFGSEKKYYWDGERNWSMDGSIGWGFKSHTWRGNLDLSRQFAILSKEGSAIIELGAGGYSLTDTKDNWIITLHENTAAALLIHEDFRDYFERNGYTVHVAYYSKDEYLKNELKLAYVADTYDSLSNKVDWAMFGGGKWFRTNPPIEPGKMRSVIASGGVSTISNTSYGPEGWSIYGSAEFAKRVWGGDFEFGQYILDLRRFQPLGKYDNFNIRVRAGSSDGTLPAQKLYELGGLGTMNAFPFKSDIGNRMLLVNAEFIINGSFFEDLDFWPMWIFHNVNILLLSDAGLTRWAPSAATALEGVREVKFNDFQNDIGVAFSNRSGSFRIGVAWRTDYPSPAHFILRFNRPF